MRLKQVDSARADSIAEFAVREAYVRGISPAIIFGVMLTENSRFISNAKSNVGAVGLMQVYPKVWLTKEMTKLFGKDLATRFDEREVRRVHPEPVLQPEDEVGAARTRDWQTALLRYNGCVKGTNTPRCHTYPNKVQKFVEGQATSICNGRGFYECIAKPFIAGLFGGRRPRAGHDEPFGEVAARPRRTRAPLRPATRRSERRDGASATCSRAHRAQRARALRASAQQTRAPEVAGAQHAEGPRARPPSGLAGSHACSASCAAHSPSSCNVTCVMPKSFTQQRAQLRQHLAVGARAVHRRRAPRVTRVRSRSTRCADRARPAHPPP